MATTKKHQTLAEAAADVLDHTRATAAREKMHNLQAERGKQPGGDVHDLGGATWENPEGNDVGSAAAAVAPNATPPGILPDPNMREPMHNVHKERGDELKSTDKLGRPTVDPDNLNSTDVPAKGGAWEPSHEYPHPTLKAPGPAAESVEPTEEEILEAHKAKMDEAREKMKKNSCKEDIDAIFSGETLSEEFRNKVTTIFEAAVVTRAVEVVEDMEKEILEAAEETVAEIKANLEEQVDSYLSLMVKEWMEENALAVENGLRTEITEDFINGLKSLFEEHNINIPAEKVNVIEELTAKVDQLTEKLNSVMDTNATLSKQVNESKKAKITEAACAGLTATQAAKVKTLAVGVEFSTEAEYEKKIKVIRESYLNPGSATKQTSVEKHVTLNEKIHEEGDVGVPTTEEGKAIDPEMSHYLAALVRTQRK